MTQKAKPKNSDIQQRNQMIIIGVIIAAAVVAIIAIVVSGNNIGGGSIAVDYEGVPMSRTSDGGFVLGNPEAPVKIIAFEDFLCPHCQAYEPTIKRFIKEYVVTGKAQFEFRILLTHQNSQMAAQFAECAEVVQPGSFWKAHDILFEIASSEYFDKDSARKFADRMELNYTDLLNCQRDAKQYAVDGQYATQLNVTGTPTIFVVYGNSAPQRQPSPPTFEQFGALVGVGQALSQ